MVRENLIAGLNRVGCIVLDSDLSLEPDLAYAFRGKVGVHVTRLRYGGQVSKDVMESAYQDVIAAGESLAPIKPSMIIYACTSGSFIHGPAGTERLEKDLERIAAFGTTAVSAVIDSLNELKMKKIALISPYSKEITSILENYLKDSGIEIASTKLLFGDQIVDDVTLQSLGKEELINALNSVKETVDGVFISCTGIRVAHLVQELESAINVPVVSSNLAIIRQIEKHTKKRSTVDSYLTRLPF